MNPLSLIPSPEIIPAPAWVFLVLDLLFFGIHILLINTALGSALIILSRGLKGKGGSLQNPGHDGVAGKIPILLALGINFGVAPLLFMQVIYGHLFYTSSVLMAVYWILIIPLLMLAYYGAYIFAKKSAANPLFSKAALWTAAFLVLLIGMLFVNNMTLMTQPEKWGAYFENRRGTLLNFSDPTLIPRYLHFVAASVAVGGLFMAFLARRREREGVTGSGENRGAGLTIFGYATIGQIIIGMWFLITLPGNFLLNFMGSDFFPTMVFLVGFTGAMGAVAAAFANRLRTTGVFFAITMAAMILTRHNLRTMYLTGKFALSRLSVTSQYGTMALFLAVLVGGILTIRFMIKLSSSEGHKGVVE